jgi:AhpD family alkylhydroperoxidase
VASVTRPRLTSRSLVRWSRPLARQAPYLLSAYLIPGRVSPRVREAAMLGVTSINRCHACQAVHGRWADRVGLRVEALDADEAAAHDFGQRLAISGPSGVRPPDGLSRRHQRELLAASLLMELANLAGNRFLGERRTVAPLQVGDRRTARLLDLLMRAADRAGVRHARARIAGQAQGDVLEIGIGTGSNLEAYPDDVAVHGLDPSAHAMAIARRRARRSGRRVTLVEGDASALPFADGTFDTVVATFVLCSVGDVGRTLAEARRVLRPGGTIRMLEHARSRHGGVSALQTRSAPVWARARGGCRLDHDVVGSVRAAGLTVLEERHHAGGLLVEVVAV